VDDSEFPRWPSKGPILRPDCAIVCSAATCIYLHGQFSSLKKIEGLFGQIFRAHGTSDSNSFYKKAVILILKIIKNYISKFQKNMKINYDVASIVFHKCVNFS
jgi:hypothetical protein